MSFSAERKAIEGHLVAQWALSGSAVPIVFDNSMPPPVNQLYMYVRLLAGQGRQVEITGDGPVLDRYVGIVQVDIVAPSSTGTDAARKCADTVAAIFRRKELIDESGGLIRFKVPSIQVFGTTPSSGAWRMIVSLPYKRDVIE